MEQYDTIIIGAGMSGLACASRLLNHPTYQAQPPNNSRPSKKLLVLEARDRVGGRIGSVRVNGNRLDTGANWIHGVGSKESPAGENPLVKILPNKAFKELRSSVSFRVPNISTKPNAEVGVDSTIIESSAEHDWVRIDASQNHGENEDESTDLVIPSEVSGDIFQTLWTLIGSLHEKAQEVTAEEAKRTSLLNVIKTDEQFHRAFDIIPHQYHATLAALPQFIENMEAGPLYPNISASGLSAPHGLGLLEFAIDDFDGKQAFLRDGYTALVDDVGKQVIEEGHVKLGAEVKSIRYDGELIEVFSTAGKFVSNCVVCTLPLGVLQHNLKFPISDTSTPFLSPPLPPTKIEAVQSLGFGTLDKIFLVYSDAWWKKSPWSSIIRKGLIVQPPESVEEGDSEVDNTTTNEPDSFWGFTTELPGISIFPTSESSKPGPRALSLMNLDALTGFPVLSCFVSCSNALHVEGLSDEAAGKLVQRSLMQWLGQETPPPAAIYVTRWAQDQFSRGSYSHMIAGLSERRHREEFGKPVINKRGAELRFAGEHTSEDHFATVHGALLSGWREADAILRKATSTAS